MLGIHSSHRVYHNNRNFEFENGSRHLHSVNYVLCTICGKRTKFRRAGDDLKSAMVGKTHQKMALLGAIYNTRAPTEKVCNQK